MVVLLGIAFVAGVITAVSPCVLPVLPIVLAGGVAGSRRRPFAVIGGLVLEWLILPNGAPPFEPARIRLRRLITGSLVVLALTTFADLVLRAQVISRAPLAVALFLH